MEYFPEIDGTKPSSQLDIAKFKGPWDVEKYKKLHLDLRNKVRKIKELHAEYWNKLLPLNDKIVSHDKKHHKTRRPRFETVFLKKQREELYEKLQACLRVYAFKLSARMSNFHAKYKKENSKGSRQNSFYNSTSHQKHENSSRQSTVRFGKDESMQ